MAKAKADHIVMANDAYLCTNCGREQKVAMPCEMEVFLAIGKAFTKSHAKCPKTWERPKPNADMTESQRIIFWLQHGETGVSSKTICAVLSGQGPKRDGCHPWDPSDFKRCHGLLEMVPEFRSRLHLMKAESKAWSNLVDNWDKLTEMLLELMETRKDNGMYDLMQQCINDKLTHNGPL